MANNFYGDKRKGIFGTIVFHLIVISVLLPFGFTTPLPLPGEQGILINFGDSDFGTGRIEPKQNEFTEEKVITPPPKEVKQDVVEENLTQDFEDAPAIEKEKPKEEPKEKIIEKPEDKPIEKKPEEKIEEIKEKPREVNKKALFPGKSTTESGSVNQGTNQGTGNQGDPEGDPSSANQEGGPNSGNKGVSFDLTGRVPQSLPIPTYKFNDEGVVVVEVTVDRNGNVIKVVPGVKGSTTLNSQLLEAAKNAAMQAKFDVKQDAPAVQKGSITYHFKLQ